ncbi:polycomb group protein FERTILIZATION-INDEPENDENT SEED 2-like [Gossypium australe]|uniref:Polycomb group protein FERTILIZATION-INDEPENDENT SEED 2-like n=1 Tax=Gossypium australe TaxID=47621 RepID=A0A5B6WKR0_9ROSI|nr:polycomb group protein FERTILIZATION-INDEPENDENT SEED 2-like [Gossypium australe]
MDVKMNDVLILVVKQVEGYIAELVFLSCYDFIDKCCDFVTKHVSVMQKLSDCPEDCREAVSSLMFAAARFSDLPELRELRRIFHERYENSLDVFANKQLVENSASNPSTMERKVMVMHDIASEFSIKWDSKAFERRMSKPAVIPQPQDRPKKYRSFHVNGDDNKSNYGKQVSLLTNLKNTGLSMSMVMIINQRMEKVLIHQGMNLKWIRIGKSGNSSARTSYIKAGKKLLHGRRILISHYCKKKEVGEKDDIAFKIARLSSSTSGKIIERVNGGGKLQDGRENSVPGIDNQDVLTQRKSDLNPNNYVAPRSRSQDEDLFIPDSYANEYGVQNSTRKNPVEGEPKQKPQCSSALPPHVKPPSIKLKESMNGANILSSLAGLDSDGVSGDPSMPDKEGQRIPPMRGHDRETDNYYSHGESGTPIPRRRSSRRRHLRSTFGHIEIGTTEDTEFMRRKPRSRRRDESRQGLQILFDEEHQRNDEEEMIINRLLMHYSKKPSTSEDGKQRRKSKSRHAHHKINDVDEEALEKASMDRSDDISETIPRPVRSIFLPREQATQSDGTKVYTRATSFQQGRSNAARHVHPKLPDYDDLAAHFAAIKER